MEGIVEGAGPWIEIFNLLARGGCDSSRGSRAAALLELAAAATRAREIQACITQLACSMPPAGHARWTLRLLARGWGR